MSMFCPNPKIKVDQDLLENASITLLPTAEALEIEAESEKTGPNGGGLLQYRGSRGVYAWDPLGEETEDEYLLFRRYRDLPPPRNLSTISRLYRIPIAEVNRLCEKYKWEYRAEAYGDYIQSILSKYHHDAAAARRINMVRDTETILEMQMGRLMTSIGREQAIRDPKTYILRIQQLSGILRQLEIGRAGRPQTAQNNPGKLVQVNFNTLEPARGEIREALDLAREVVETIDGGGL